MHNNKLFKAFSSILSSNGTYSSNNSTLHKKGHLQFKNCGFKPCLKYSSDLILVLVQIFKGLFYGDIKY